MCVLHYYFKMILQLLSPTFHDYVDQHICPNISVEENTLLGVLPSEKETYLHVQMSFLNTLSFWDNW